jgi:hypothetical protein
MPAMLRASVWEKVCGIWAVKSSWEMFIGKPVLRVGLRLPDIGCLWSNDLFSKACDAEVELYQKMRGVGACQFPAPAKNQA